MSESHNVFSDEDIEWFDEMEAIMKRAVEKARAENERLGLDPEECLKKVFPDSELVSSED